MPALGKSVSCLGWLSPMPTSPALSLPQAYSWGLSVACRGGECSRTGSALGQYMEHGWKPLAGIPVPDPRHVPTPSCLLAFSFPFAKRFLGAVVGWRVHPSGRRDLTLLCLREQWRAAAWASPSSVPLC